MVVDLSWAVANKFRSEIGSLLRYYAALSATFCTDVSWQIIGPNFKGQKVQEDFLTLENETDSLFRNVGTELSLNTA
jgi:hypothetical protein